MIAVAIEHYVFISTGLALVGFAATCVARPLLLSGRWAAHPRTVSGFYAAMLVLPVIGAAWLVGASFLPLWVLVGPTLGAAHPAPLHRLHMLEEMTARLEPGLMYATLAFLSAAALVVVVKGVRGYVRVGRAIERLQGARSTLPREQLALVDAMGAAGRCDLAVLRTHHALAFVWGFWRPRLVVSSGLLAAVTPAGLAAVLEHERAHVLRRDNLTRCLLLICSHASLVAPLSLRIVRWHTEQVELVCDEVAAAVTRHPLDVAEALVATRRSAPSLIEGWPLREATSSFPVSDSQTFERRVRRLVAMADAVLDPGAVAALVKGPRDVALGVLGAVVLMSAGLWLWMPLGVHRAAEAVIQMVR